MVSKSLEHLQVLTDKLHQRDRELEAQDIRLKLALKAANIGLWHWCPDADLLIWDNRMFEIFRPDLLGKIEPNSWRGAYADFVRCLHPDDLDRVGREIRECLENGKYYRVKYRVVHQDGAIRHVKALGQALDKNNTCKEVCMTGVCIDITDEVEDA
jgi:PAS domain-containing protein